MHTDAYGGILMHVRYQVLGTSYLVLGTIVTRCIRTYCTYCTECTFLTTCTYCTFCTVLVWSRFSWNVFPTVLFEDFVWRHAVWNSKLAIAEGIFTKGVSIYTWCVCYISLYVNIYIYRWIRGNGLEKDCCPEVSGYRCTPSYEIGRNQYECKHSSVTKGIESLFFQHALK